MTIQDFKKIGRLLKTVYAEIEKEALKEGMDLLSSQYQEVIDKARLALLAKYGFTLEEYRQVKEEVAGVSRASILQTNKEMKVAKEMYENTHVPTTEEITEIAEQVAKKYIVPPKITNQIVKETVVEKPIKETIIQREEYDPSPLMAEIGFLNEKLNNFKIPDYVPPDLEALKLGLRSEWEQNLNESISIKWQKEMPDFRKLAMGLQQQIDEINAGDVEGPSSSTDNAIARFDGTTGKLIQNSGVAINDTGQVLAINGTTAAPAFANATQVGTGIWFPSSGTRIAQSIEGTEYVRLAPDSLQLITNNMTLTWGASSDLVLARDNANILALRNGTTAQLFNIYDTFTSSSAYERMEIGVNPGGIGSNRFGIITTQLGGGTAQPLHLGTGGSAEIHLRTSDASRWQVSSSGHFVATTDNSIDIGASGATRPRTLYTGTSVISPTVNLTTAGSGGYFFGADQGTQYGFFQSSGIVVKTANTNRWTFSDTGHLTAVSDNSYDIGAAGATRPRTAYIGTGISIGGATASDASLAVRGAGATLATKPLLIEDSAGVDTFAIRNDGSLGFGKNFSLPDTSSYFAMRTGADFGGAITITNTVNGINAPVGGLSFQIRYAGTQEYGRAEGISAIVESSNTGTGNVLSAFTGSARITNASGKATTLRGAYFDANTDGATSGTVTNMAALEGVLLVSHASVTATNAYGLKISDFTNLGTITNTYGIYVGDITGGTQTNQAYNIYLSDTSARNYLGGNVILPNALIATPDSRSGAGAVSVTTLTTALTSTGIAEAITLANGTNGQIKTIVHDVDGGSMVLTPATATGWTTATFAVAGDTLTLQYFTTRGWMVLSSYGTVVA